MGLISVAAPPLPPPDTLPASALEILLLRALAQAEDPPQ